MAEWRKKMARFLAPELMEPARMTELVREEVRRAEMARPISLDPDQRDGYRKITSDGVDQSRRDLSPVNLDLMIELAYHMYDTSGMVKRFVRDMKNFVLGEGVAFSVSNDSEQGDAMRILHAFWNDPMNQMDIRMEKRIEFLGLLGEQCWPVNVNPKTGRVWVSYVDPANIEDVHTVRSFPEIPAAVQLKSQSGRPGGLLTAIREELDPRQKAYGRLVGDCFFHAVNNPPNSPRGRSDLIHMFDFINGFEEGLFDELDRLKHVKAFVWDVLIQGGTDEQIRDFLRHNKAPKPGSVRAHNERVTWNAVAPDLKMGDNKAFFDMMKSYLSACANRPDSWLGGGGKAYQTEADLMGEPTFKDLGSRQRHVKYMLEHMLRFVLDQAVLAGTLKERNGERFDIVVNMPEMTTKNLKGIVEALFSLAQSLTLAEGQGWISKETSGLLFANVASQTGIEIDAVDEIRKAAEGSDPNGSKDYAGKEAMIAEVLARLKNADERAE